MIRFTYESTRPYITDGRVITGIDQYDDWWLAGAILNSGWVENNGKAILVVRGRVGDDGGWSILRADATADLIDPNSWTILHVAAAAFKPTDMPSPYGLYPGTTGDLDIFVDPDTAGSGGYNRIWITFKHKYNFIDRATYPQWDSTFTGGAVSATQDLGMKVAWNEQVQITVTSGGATLVQGVDYSVANEGSSSLNAVITYLTDQSGVGLTFKFSTESFRYSTYSDDGGQTWNYYGPFVDAAGRPDSFGQTSLFKYTDSGGYTWHAVTTNTPTNPGSAFNYMRSTGPLNGAYGPAWIWSDETKIADLDGPGHWNSTCAIGTAAYIKNNHIYLLGTCGYGADINRGNDPDVTVDETLAVNNDPHNDYPSGHGMWRCPLDDMTTSGSWDEHGQNPVMIRSSIGMSASGGNWNGHMLTRDDGVLITHEAVGMVQGPLSQQQAENLRDKQYGGEHSKLRLAKQTEYIAANLTLYIKIAPDTLRGSIMARGPDWSAYRDPPFEAGNFYVTLLEDGSVQCRWYVAGAVGLTERVITSAVGLVTTSSAHEVVVAFTPTAVNLYVDSNSNVVSGLGAQNTVNDKVITFGSGGADDQEYYGNVWRVKVFNTAETFSTAQAAIASGTVGYYNFATNSAGSPATSLDDSPSGYDIDLLANVRRISGGGDIVRLGGAGCSYDNGTIGSQQHQARYRGPGFDAEWTGETFPGGSFITIRNVKTGKYLANGATQSAPYSWQVSRSKGFWHLKSGSQVLASSDRFGTQTTVALEAEKTDFTSPYLRYDQQHWHRINTQEGFFYLQNRACSRVLSDIGGRLSLENWSGSPDGLWQIELML